MLPPFKFKSLKYQGRSELCLGFLPFRFVFQNELLDAYTLLTFFFFSSNEIRSKVISVSFIKIKIIGVSGNKETVTYIRPIFFTVF